MERVNLIPDDVALTWKDYALAFVDRRFGQVAGWTVGVVCLLQAAVAVNQAILMWRYTKQTAALSAKRETAIAEMENAKAYLAQLEQAEGQLTQQGQWLMQRVKYLSVYRERQGEWAAILQEVKRAIPYGVWLTEFEGSGEGKLRIAGGAFEDRLVTQFMGQLKVNPRLTNVAFTFTRKAKIGKTDIIAFELTCQAVAAGAATS